MGTLSSLSSGIKSVQRGTFAPSGNSGGNITIASVNTSKSVLFLDGFAFMLSNSTLTGLPVAGSLTSSTNIFWSCNRSGYSVSDSPQTSFASWQVVEYN